MVPKTPRLGFLIRSYELGIATGLYKVPSLNFLTSILILYLFKTACVAGSVVFFDELQNLGHGLGHVNSSLHLPVRGGG